VTAAEPEPTRLGMVIYPSPEGPELASFYTAGLGLPVAFTDGDRFTALRAGNGLIALAAPAESIAGPSPAAAFLVSDLDATIERLCSLGAKVIRPAESGPHERRAALEDPAGNPFVVYVPVASQPGSS
jgi:predicted enzyme related to lactoylglutathione lyase